MLGSPQIAAVYNSSFSGHIEVIRGWGVLYIRTGDVFQSGDLVRGIWQDALKNLGKKNKTWLALGVAGGSVLKLVSAKYSPKHMTAVEIDPVMIEIGKKYFGLDKIKNLELVNADASLYIKNLKSRYDYVLVDLVFANHHPAFLSSPEFLKQLKQSGQLVFINRLYHTPKLQKAADAYVRKLQRVFSSVIPVRTHQNLVLVCS